MVFPAFWPSVPVLSWLTVLLVERLGDDFSLVLEEGAVAILCAQAKGKIFVKVDALMFSGCELTGCAQWSGRQEGWELYFGDTLPAPGLSSIDKPLISKNCDEYYIDYDIFGLAYWMLARCEEVNSADLDRYGRFPAQASHAFKHGYLNRPIVDEWLAILRQVIERQWPELTLKPACYTMKVSHDVDELSRYGFKSLKGLLRTVAVDVLKRRDLLAPFRAMLVKLGGARGLSRVDPANTFSWLMGLSERYGLISAFYFICGRTHPTMDADYELEHPATRKLLHEIHGRGHEIGLHPSFESFLDPQCIAAEATRLLTVCAQEGLSQEGWGGRMHYLRWSHPRTMRAWERAGMAYDSTLGYAEVPGFRCGTCYEYPAFDPVEGRQLALRIRPLIAMDVTIMSPTYMGLGSGAAALDTFLQLIDTCRAVGGCFTLLWHNSNLSSVGERALYERVLELGTVVATDD